MSQPGVGQPAGPMPDRCPYSRPFPEDFSDCATYQRQQFVAATTQEQPLGMHLTCVHLRVGERGHNRFYAQCALGTAADRRAWLRQVGQQRVKLMRQLQVDFAELYSGADAEQLAQTKADAIAAPDDAEAAARLASMLSDLSSAMREFIESRADVLEEAGFPIDSLQSLVDSALDRWRVSPRMGTPPIEAEELDPFAPELRPFLGGTLREEHEAGAR